MSDLLSPETKFKMRAQLELRNREASATAQNQANETRYRNDPGAWFREVLGDELWGTQLEIAESVRDNDETAVASCHAIGKSFTASRIVMWFLYNFRPSIVVTTAPTRRHVAEILWQEIANAHSSSKIPLAGKPLTTKLTIAPKHFAIGFTGKQKQAGKDGGESLVGFHQDHILVVVDEASGIDPATEEELDALLSSGAIVRKLSIGNPVRPSGPFFNAFQKPRHGLKTFQISAFDTPNFTTFGITLDDIRTGAWEDKIGDSKMPATHLINPKWVANKFDKWGEGSPAFQSRILAQFPKDNSSALVPLYLLEDAVRRNLKPGFPHRLSLDVARFGEDDSAMYERKGDRFRLADSWQGERLTETARRATSIYYNKAPADIVVDEVGVGGGVVDIMYEEGLPVVALNAGKAPADDDKRFANLRAELYWGIREAAERGTLDLDPEDEDVIVQLSSIQYTHRTSDGAIQIESKKEMKRRGMGSPDNADALVLTLAPDSIGVESDRDGDSDVVIV
jgi:phage terminase large subunit